MSAEGCGLACGRAHCSGGAYPGDPTRKSPRAPPSFARSRSMQTSAGAADATRERPKSKIRRWPVADSMMRFAGFMSLCTTPISCNAARPRNNCSPKPNDSSKVDAIAVELDGSGSTVAIGAVAAARSGSLNHSSSVTPSHSSMCTRRNTCAVSKACAVSETHRGSVAPSTGLLPSSHAASLASPTPSPAHSKPSEHSADRAVATDNVDNGDAGEVSEVLCQRGLRDNFHESTKGESAS
mmetsp:Transcript_21720/g.60676  ORF Transcript_21720/g.60676 Transcript_21720/m.60676 type:complete len:239 (-) Transcript_21720:418-1134(-)